MSSIKMMVLSALRKVPGVQRWATTGYYRLLLKDLTEATDQFGKRNVRYVDVIHRLYDVLKDAELSYEEDFDWMRNQLITVSTKTSGDAYTLLSILIEEKRIALTETYFRAAPIVPVPVNTWYSNQYSVERFLDLGLTLLELYCLYNPKLEDVKTSAEGLADQDIPTLNPSLQQLLSGKDFKLLVEDLIEVVRLIVRSHVRN
jgi:hypothetical protein